jgi:putative transposase
MTRTKKIKSKADELLDELLAQCKSPEDILGKHGLLDQLRKRAVERALNGELTAHLGYEAHERADERRANTRNGSSSKRVLTAEGSMELAVPRDRDGSFEPLLIRKGQRRLARMDQQIIALYARGLTTREIQGHLEELYGVDVSAGLISNVTAEVAEDAQAWQSRQLEALYPIVYFDALFVKSREGGRASNRAVYLALAVKLSGEKELLGMWISDSEGAKFWLSIFTELQNRGMRDCLIACVDGLKGFEEALQAVFPRTQAQLCIVHKVRSSLRYVPTKQRKAVAADLREIYSAPTVSAAQAALSRFAERWDAQYPLISQSWRRDWALLTTFFDYPPEIRKVIYTTNAVESLNYSLRRVLKNRGAFPDDASVFKVLYLAIQRAAKKWTMPLHNWADALNRFAIMFPDRVNLESVTQNC